MFVQICHHLVEGNDEMKLNNHSHCESHQAVIFKVKTALPLLFTISKTLRLTLCERTFQHLQVYGVEHYILNRFHLKFSHLLSLNPFGF